MNQSKLEAEREARENARSHGLFFVPDWLEMFALDWLEDCTSLF